MKYCVTLDITVEAKDREEAFEKVEIVLKDVDSYCLYSAVIVESEDDN